jgi:hypothetical protein
VNPRSGSRSAAVASSSSIICGIWDPPENERSRGSTKSGPRSTTRRSEPPPASRSAWPRSATPAKARVSPSTGRRPRMRRHRRQRHDPDHLQRPDVLSRWGCKQAFDGHAEKIRAAYGERIAKRLFQNCADLSSGELPACHCPGRKVVVSPRPARRVITRGRPDKRRQGRLRWPHISAPTPSREWLS